MRPRAYLDIFHPLVEGLKVRRAVVLLGPRRVGKTVLLHHSIEKLLKSGADPRTICYISIDHPLYNGLGLEELLECWREAAGSVKRAKGGFVFFDEIQYLRDWEVHLKTLVDSHRGIKFIASGSAAAALWLKSRESGAGRFTNFLLPPLTFHEFLHLQGRSVEYTTELDSSPPIPILKSPSVEDLNAEFLKYVNFGGYPEALFSQAIQADPARFIKSDIIDKVLLRDLPSLYGIQDIQELNSLFTTLAFNTAQEVSLEGLSKGSGVAKNTIKKYIEYLEAAFLIKSVHRVDRSGKRFQRANYFKVYLTNPSIWSALFSPVGPDDPAMPSLAETAVFAQWFHHPTHVYYGRWDRGEVDLVGLDPRLRPSWVVEVKWSDRAAEHPEELRGVLGFVRDNGLRNLTVTTRSVAGGREFEGVRTVLMPTSLYCYIVSERILQAKD